MLAKIQAIAAGMDDAVMLDPRGFVAEGTGMCIFIIKKGVFISPKTDYTLDSITRATLMELAEEMGNEVAVRDISPHDLYVADEALLCGSGAEVIAVGEVDGRRIGSGEMGPLTREIKEKYMELVRK